ncbi:MAG: DsbA family protein [Opitutaceae bacterium]|nr:DsbA family protein [Opitutaceae bacterium]
MKVTYYLEIFSSWCYYTEPVWSELKRRYAGRAEFEWQIALMGPQDYPASRAQCDWFYRRSGGTVMHTPYMLNSGWFEAERRGHYQAAGYVAEAGRQLGVTDDRIRLALAEAALREGQRIGDLGTAVTVAAQAGNLDPKKLRRAAASAAVRARVAASTAAFLAHQVNQRPAFVLTDVIGDKAVFSGLVRLEPLAATIEAMLHDTAAYAAHAAHHGRPPSR